MHSQGFTSWTTIALLPLPHLLILVTVAPMEEVIEKSCFLSHLQQAYTGNMLSVHDRVCDIKTSDSTPQTNTEHGNANDGNYPITTSPHTQLASAQSAKTLFTTHGSAFKSSCTWSIDQRTEKTRGMGQEHERATSPVMPEQRAPSLDTDVRTGVHGGK